MPDDPLPDWFQQSGRFVALTRANSKLKWGSRKADYSHVKSKVRRSHHSTSSLIQPFPSIVHPFSFTRPPSPLLNFPLFLQVPFKDNEAHTPGGGDRQIWHQKLDLSHVRPRVDSSGSSSRSSTPMAGKVGLVKMGRGEERGGVVCGCTKDVMFLCMLCEDLMCWVVCDGIMYLRMVRRRRDIFLLLCNVIMAGKHVEDEGGREARDEQGGQPRQHHARARRGAEEGACSDTIMSDWYMNRNYSLKSHSGLQCIYRLGLNT